MKKVLVFGTFDGLHRGHVSFLKQARKHGDYLIVVVTRDSNVKKLKGKLPMQNEGRRAAALRKFADKVLLGEKKVTYRLIKKLNPDVICVGYDQRPSISHARKILRKLRMKKISLKRMKPYKPSLYKSSVLNKLR